MILVLRGLSYLLWCEMLLRSIPNRPLYGCLSKKKIAPRVKPFRTAPEIVHAVDIACVFYFKRVRCLQRSVVTTLMLRKSGFAAELVVGTRVVPFEHHAWVECEGSVLNDKPYVTSIYVELCRV